MFSKLHHCPGVLILFGTAGNLTILGLRTIFAGLWNSSANTAPVGKHIANNIQTNGVLLTDEWCSFFAAENFSVGLSLDGPRALHDAYRVAKDQKALRTGR